MIASTWDLRQERSTGARAHTHTHTHTHTSVRKNTLRHVQKAMLCTIVSSVGIKSWPFLVPYLIRDPRAVSKLRQAQFSTNCVQRGFFVAASTMKFWKCDFGSASESVFLGILRCFFYMLYCSKKGCSSSHQITHLLLFGSFPLYFCDNFCVSLSLFVCLCLSSPGVRALATSHHELQMEALRHETLYVGASDWLPRVSHNGVSRKRILSNGLRLLVNIVLVSKCCVMPSCIHWAQTTRTATPPQSHLITLGSTED